MPRASSARLATSSRIYAKRRRKSKRTMSNLSVERTVSLFSEAYELPPCYCDNGSRRLMNGRQSSVLAKSSNAFWRRNRKSTAGAVGKKQQRNNSTGYETKQMGSSHFHTLRKSVLRRFKGNERKRKMPTITARSVTRKRIHAGDLLVNHSNTEQTNFPSTAADENRSNHSGSDFTALLSHDHSYAENEEEDNRDALESTFSAFQTEQQNINATNNTRGIFQESSNTMMNGRSSTRKVKKTAATSKRKRSTKSRHRSVRAPSSLSKVIPARRKGEKSKRKPMSSSSMRRNVERTAHNHSPFPDPNFFHSLPAMQNSAEITEDNVHKNHLCCKPITSVKGLSTSDQKKLIERDYLTLISLLPIYLGSQGHFRERIREKTNISSDGASELDRLMNEWSSARLFIGSVSPNKTLTQTI